MGSKERSKVITVFKDGCFKGCWFIKVRVTASRYNTTLW